MLWKKLVGTKAYATTVVGDNEIVHAFAFEAKAEVSSTPETVAVLVNWDDSTDRNRTVSLRGCKGEATVYKLTPAGPIHDGDDSRNDIIAESTGIALNGRELAVAADGRVPLHLLDGEILRCDSGQLSVELAGLTAAFVQYGRG